MIADVTSEPAPDLRGAGADSSRRIRVLYSFPQRLGAGRICLTAWNQAEGLSKAGADVRVMAGSVERELNGAVKVMQTLCPGNVKLPFRMLGRRMVNAIHDSAVAGWLAKNPGAIDIVHVWPLAALRTIRTARSLGIPTVLERPNAHTGYAFREVAEECRRVGMALAENHDHAWNQRTLEHEEKEYRECDHLLCPSPFVAETFEAEGFGGSKLLRHQYGYDGGAFSPDPSYRSGDGLEVVYAGVCEPRKGLHMALDAWLQSPASRKGRFRICGSFVPGYEDRLGQRLLQPGVEYLGQRSDLPGILSSSDVFVLPSIEEGSALVTYEARASGCVLLVSDRAGAVAEHGVDSLIHRARDVAELSGHFTMLNSDRGFLSALRGKSLAGAGKLTWTEAGVVLLNAYRQAIASQCVRAA